MFNRRYENNDIFPKMRASIVRLHFCSHDLRSVVGTIGISLPAGWLQQHGQVQTPLRRVAI